MALIRSENDLQQLRMLCEFRINIPFSSIFCVLIPLECLDFHLLNFVLLIHHSSCTPLFFSPLFMHSTLFLTTLHTLHSFSHDFSYTPLFFSPLFMHSTPFLTTLHTLHSFSHDFSYTSLFFSPLFMHSTLFLTTLHALHSFSHHFSYRVCWSPSAL